MLFINLLLLYCPTRFAVPANRRGQATVEYVVVVLAASLLAGLFIRWVNGTGKIGELLDRVIDTVIGSI
ncbi:MAG: hypothetical protein HKN24_14955 [Acidimicrobiales bacterium]|nr:hypothetical protein [Acidimicrobiales bacterium]